MTEINKGAFRRLKNAMLFYFRLRSREESYDSTSRGK